MHAVAERDAAIAERDRLIALNDRLVSCCTRHRSTTPRASGWPSCIGRSAQSGAGRYRADDRQGRGDQGEDAGRRSPRKRQINRGAFPAHLPRVHETITPADRNYPCCNGPMHVIGEETSERLDVIPAQFRVIVTHRPKLACRACEQIVQAAAPEHLIKSGLPTEALVAHVLVTKYGRHFPLYRQAKMLAAQGLDLDRPTLAFWVGYAAAELTPLYERLKAKLLTSVKLAVDETPVPVLDPGRGQTKTGYFWAIARDDRTWGGGTASSMMAASSSTPTSSSARCARRL